MKDGPSFIVTFYSYKGGVGRTMALANIGVLLAQQGMKALAVDFDLEAPGLHRYFTEYGIHEDSDTEGMLEILVEAGTGKEPIWADRVVPVQLRATGSLSMLRSGRHDDSYPQRVLDFNWREFFEQRNGGAHIERLRNEWRDAFDIVLIDSRTGITDSGGVCTIQLPDVLVPMFTANDQSVQGCRNVAHAAQQARQQLAFDRPPLLVFPLPARFDSRAQYEESRTWLTTFAEELGECYEAWLPMDIAPRQVLERTKLPYVAFFSFGEKLPVVTEGTSDPESLGYAYATAASLIGSRFQDVENILFGSPLPASVATFTLEREAFELESRARARASSEERSRSIGRAGWLAVVLTLASAFSLLFAALYFLLTESGTILWALLGVFAAFAIVAVLWQVRRRLASDVPRLWHALADEARGVITMQAPEAERRLRLDELREKMDLLEGDRETTEAPPPGPPALDADEGRKAR